MTDNPKKKLRGMAATKAKGPLKPDKDGVVRLSGGNPQIAKGDGDAPVQAYIKALPGWKSGLGKRLDPGRSRLHRQRRAERGGRRHVDALARERDQHAGGERAVVDPSDRDDPALGHLAQRLADLPHQLDRAAGGVERDDQAVEVALARRVERSLELPEVASVERALDADVGDAALGRRVGGRGRVPVADGQAADRDTLDWRRDVRRRRQTAVLGHANRADTDVAGRVGRDHLLLQADDRRQLAVQPGSGHGSFLPGRLRVRVPA